MARKSTAIEKAALGLLSGLKGFQRQSSAEEEFQERLQGRRTSQRLARAREGRQATRATREERAAGIRELETFDALGGRNLDVLQRGMEISRLEKDLGTLSPDQQGDLNVFQEFQTERKAARALTLRGDVAGVERKESLAAGPSGDEIAPEIVNSILTGRDVASSFSKRKGMQRKVRRAVLKVKPDFDFIGAETKFQEIKAASKFKGGGGQEKEWRNLSRTINPAQAPKSSLVGVAGNVNARADRELATLALPDLSPQQLSGAITGLASILKGGVPTEIEIQEQSYKTFKTDIANIQTFWFSRPTAANQPEVVDRLRTLIAEIKRVDNKIILDNLATQKIAFKKVIGTDPERWEALRQSVINTTTGLEQTRFNGDGEAEEIRRAHAAKEIDTPTALKMLEDLK